MKAHDLYRIVNGPGDGGSIHSFSGINPATKRGWEELAKLLDPTTSRIRLAQSDNFRHIICYLANAGGMKMRAARLVIDTLGVNAKEALQYVEDVQRFWRETTPSGEPMKPLPASLRDTLKPLTTPRP